MPDSIDELVTRISTLENTVAAQSQQISAMAEQLAAMPQAQAGATTASGSNIDDHTVNWLLNVLHKWFSGDAPDNPTAPPKPDTTGTDTGGNG